MNSFEILDSKDSRYGCIVINKDYHPLSDKIMSLNVELANRKFSGTVLFNNLSAALSEDRQYISCVFDGSKIDLRSFKIVKKIDRSTSRIIKMFFSNNPEILNKSPTRFI